MPTSPRDLMDGTGGYLTTRPVVGPSGPMKGIGPYARGKPLPSIVPRPSSIGVPSTPVPGCARSTLSKQERASPHPSRLRRSTFPGGEGFLRRGHSLTFPWGKVPPQRRKRGGTKSVLRPAPHPSGLRPATLSQERVFPSSVTPYGVPPSPCGKASSGGCVPYLPFGFSNNFSVYPFTNPLLCCKIGSSSQKLWEVWS